MPRRTYVKYKRAVRDLKLLFLGPAKSQRRGE